MPALLLPQAPSTPRPGPCPVNLISHSSTPWRIRGITRIAARYIQISDMSARQGMDEVQARTLRSRQEPLYLSIRPSVDPQGKRNSTQTADTGPYNPLVPSPTPECDISHIGAYAQVNGLYTVDTGQWHSLYWGYVRHSVRVPGVLLCRSARAPLPHPARSCAPRRRHLGCASLRARLPGRPDPRSGHARLGCSPGSGVPAGQCPVPALLGCQHDLLLRGLGSRRSRPLPGLLVTVCITSRPAGVRIPGLGPDLSYGE